MLLAWAVDVYPQLHGYESQMANLSSFDKVAEDISRYGGSNNLTMPKEYKSRKQVVDLFAHDIKLNPPKDDPKELNSPSEKRHMMMV